MTKILLVEDDTAFCDMLAKFLVRKSFEVIPTYTAEQALSVIETQKLDLIITDLRLPNYDGIELMSQFKKKLPNIPVILMTGYSDVATAVKAIKNGASDYISKPFNPDEVLLVIENSLKNTDQKVQKIAEKKPQKIAKTSKSTTDFVTGISPASKKLSEYINLVSPTDISVLIIGESGTGKEVIAKSIHENSNRKDRVFIAVDCGTIPKDLAASEFFGHVKGSFTGAISDKVGYFEAANGGTIFLDEIGNLSYDNQIQLLRALQERKIKPVGSTKEMDVDVRVLAATNEDLREAVKNGEFREDLYHRINEFTFDSPALRNRGGDILLFADYFLEKANQQLNKEVVGFSPDVISVFQNYNWPGNLREMQNCVKRATLLTQGDFIEKSVLPAEFFEVSKSNATEDFSISGNEKDLIIATLAKTQNNKTETAKLLNINRKTLYNKLKLYKLD